MKEVSAEEFLLVTAYVGKLNKKAAKLKLPPIELVNVVYFDKPREKDGRIYAIDQRVSFEIAGTPPKINGWSFASKIIHDPVLGNLFKTAPGYNMMHYRDSGSNCDHCNINRKRNSTFVLVHDSGDELQLGSACVKDFFGHVNPADINWWFSLGDEIEAKEFEPKVQTYWNTTYVLSVAYAQVELSGFVSRKLAEETGKEATASEVSAAMCSIGSRFENDYKNLFNLADSNFITQKVQQTVADILAWPLSKQSENELSHHIYNAINIGKILPWQVGQIAWLPTMYADKKTPKSNEWVGKIGDKKVKITAKVKKIVEGESQFGWARVTNFAYTLEDAAGNMYKFTNGSCIMSEDETYTFTATIKDHRAWNNRKWTQLKMVKVIEN